MSAQHPISASDNSSVFESRIPHEVRPGQMFEVQIPNGNRFKVCCPQGMSGGEVFRIQPFQVTIPEGVRGNRRVFTAIVNGESVAVRAPSNKHPGEAIIIHFPVFPRPSAAPPAENRKTLKKDTWNPAKWQEYLNMMKETMPEINPEIAHKIATIDAEVVPNEFICPITTEIIMDPVVAVDGHTYEREAIEKWFVVHDTSPKTNDKLPSKILIPNRAIRSQIIDFIEHYQPPAKATPAQSSGVKNLEE
eukprot:c4261_g1_i1.p1 GENE.c4261_g1_i1~~c4261_g1_i1.p1  ORF type:complete len:248 (+),score=45.07 c4261_g1_i1:47-790(+)